MAQTGYTPISIYYSSTASNTPTAGNLVAGELAINTADGKLFYKDSAGVVQTIASKATGTVAGSTTQVIYNNAGAYAGSANLTFDGTNLGVGTAPTSYSGYTTLALNNATNGGLLDIQLAGSRIGSFMAGSSTELRMYAGASVNSTFYAGGSERMRIDSSGNVGIDTTSPAYRLQVRRAGGAGSLGISVDTIVAAVRDVQYYGVPDSSTGASAHTFYIRNGSTTNTLALRISQDGTLTLRDGDTSATGVGITFPSTQISSANANTLDDYEEGTFTPTWTRDGGNPSYTVSSGDTGGRYTKIGNLVTVSFEFRTSAISSNGSGGWEISSLPFTSNGSIPRFFGAIGRFYNGAEITGIRVQLNNNSTKLSFYTVATDSSYSATPSGGIVIMQGTISYQV
jgi:hypothetical protein